MGYQKDEAKTKAAFTDDGWLKSGDLGLFDEDQFLFLKGRLKELIITAGGENIAPVPIEEAIKTELSDVVSYAIVVGEKKKYLSCVITLKVGTDAETMQPTRLLDPSVVSWAEKMGCQGLETLDDFISGPHAEKLRNAIQIGLDAVNSGAGSNPQRIQKFAILPNEFSVLGGELGPTLKIKRYSVYEKYASYIENMYSST